MHQKHALHRWALLAVALLCLAASIAACASVEDNPREARSGTWRGETAFGSFSFTVCEGGRRITDYTLEYTAGGTQMLSMSEGGELLIDDDNAFDLSTPEAGVTFRGQFSEDGKSASGLWEVTASGETVSEAWALER
jgi:hypothetical protein